VSQPVIDFFAAAHSFKSFMLNLAHWIITALEKQAGHGYHDAPIWHRQQYTLNWSSECYAIRTAILKGAHVAGGNKLNRF